MKARFLLSLLFFVSVYAVADPHPGDSGGARNKDGSIVTGVLTAQFDPAAGVLPFPNNLLYQGTTDLTLNPPVADPTDKSDLTVALSSLDGFSPTEKWVATFTDDNGNPGSIDPASVRPGESVRVFQVTTPPFVFPAVASIVRELMPLEEYVAVAAPGGVLAIIPTRPLDEYTAYMAVVTNDIRDTDGNNATPDQTYFLSKRRTPWVDANGSSTYPLIDDDSARTLEQLRQITLSMELNAAGRGVNPDDIILAWTVQTMSVSRTLKELRNIAEPAPVVAAPTPFDTSAVGGRGWADISIGVITLPYYLGIPSEENPAAPLTDNWEAVPGAYVPPFDQLGLDPNSTNITVANPFPALTDTVTVPLIMTTPSAASGRQKPATGWPVAIYSHGITRNRTDMLAVADAAAAAGYALIAMDHPLHGVVPEVEPQLAPFYIENTPLGAFAEERTFRVDFFNNVTQQPGPDGIPDRSGQSYFNLLNFQAARDNLRQSIADLSVLAVSLQNISTDGDATPDFDPMNVAFVAHSYGVFIGVPFLAIEPTISHAYINAGGAILLRTAEAGSFGVLIRGLLAGAGVLPGTPEFEQFLTVGQTVLGSADAASWAAEAAMKVPMIHNVVMQDDTVPNTVPGEILAGSEGLNRLMGLDSYSTSQMNPDGLLGVARFLPPAIHSSFFRPEASPAATAEMQGQMASFLGSNGFAVSVANPDILVPVIEPGDLQISPPLLRPIEGKKKDKPGSGGWQPVLQSRGQVVKSGEQFND